MIFCFSGCAQVEHSRVVYSDGRIVDAIAVKLDEEKIVNKGYDLASLKSKIKTKMNKYILALQSSFLSRDDNLTTQEKSFVLFDMASEVGEKQGYIYATINFKDYTTFKYFYGLHLQDSSQTESEDENIVSTPLYTKSVSVSQTVFASSICEDIAQDFLNDYGGNFDLDDVDFSFLLGMPESRLHSNATTTYSSNGITYHEWNLSSTTEEIVTFSYLLKPVNWYILALSLTFVLFIVLTLVAMIERIIKRKEFIKTIN